MSEQGTEPAPSSFDDAQAGDPGPGSSNDEACPSSPASLAKSASWGLDNRQLEQLAAQMAEGGSDVPTGGPEYPAIVPLSTSSSGCDSPGIGTLRACKGCQKAKTACSPDQRPCSRCTRLNVSACDCRSPRVRTHLHVGRRHARACPREARPATGTVRSRRPSRHATLLTASPCSPHARVRWTATATSRRSRLPAPTAAAPR